MEPTAIASVIWVLNDTYRSHRVLFTGLMTFLGYMVFQKYDWIDGSFPGSFQIASILLRYRWGVKSVVCIHWRKNILWFRETIQFGGCVLFLRCHLCLRVTFHFDLFFSQTTSLIFCYFSFQIRGNDIHAARNGRSIIGRHWIAFRWQ